MTAPRHHRPVRCGSRPRSTAPSPATSRWTRSVERPSPKRCDGSNATCTGPTNATASMRTMQERHGGGAGGDGRPRSPTAPKKGRRPEPLVCILAGEATIEHLCELVDRASSSPPTWSSRTSAAARCRRSSSTAPTGSSPPPRPARSVACCAGRSKSVTATANTRPGVTNRSPTATSTTRVPYAEGGVTDEAGGDLECESHNRKSDLHDAATRLPDRRSPLAPRDGSSHPPTHRRPRHPTTPTRSTDHHPLPELATRSAHGRSRSLDSGTRCPPLCHRTSPSTPYSVTQNGDRSAVWR